MTNVEKLFMMKEMIDQYDGDDDSTLVTYLQMAGQIIINKAYPYDADTVQCVPARYGVLQCEIAAYLYNKKGAEGETTHDENGIKRVYAAGSVPDDMLSQIVPLVGVVGFARPEEK